MGLFCFHHSEKPQLAYGQASGFFQSENKNPHKTCVQKKKFFSGVGIMIGFKPCPELKS